MVLEKGQKDGLKEQNRELETDLHKHAQLIFDRSANVIQWKKDDLFKYKSCWSN